MYTMENKYILTEDIVSLLKCSLCDHFLSVSPVSIISDDGLKYKCGRCHPIRTHVETRAIMYENLAKYMTFPCIYKDCDKKLNWHQVKDHESKCPHRTLMCPRLNCEDVIGINSFVSHFKEKHKDVYHSEKFMVEDVYNYHSLDLLEKDGKVFVIIFDYDDVRYGISVCSLEPDDRQYELILDSENRKLAIVFTEQDIVPFDEKTHCFKCVTGSCKSESHVYRYYKKGILKRMTTKLDRDCVKRTFGGRHMNHTINIVDAKPEEDDLDDDLIVKDMVIDEVDDEEDDAELVKEEEII
ncbi:hypothetical protein NQ314_017946 [Rhamnusium bicolor]|uniref:RING-type E3 ubiquitin transferase n=1 Tax=Rhamnusium bicolor TaxID=1586634 RepID=A0AAV8WRG6_9CUCU|nr:hypothetical protein NQ314_017946 [Rhamnusium bicolor]